MNAQYHPGEGIACRGETAYEAAHEWAHLDQEVRASWVWRLHAFRFPFTGHFTLFLLELHASFLALRSMLCCGCLDQFDLYEAWRGLKSHAIMLLDKSAKTANAPRHAPRCRPEPK